MKRTALFICALASIACHADELYIASNVMASSLDGLEFLLNGRPFFTGTVNKGSCSFSGPVSEWIKAGTNTLGVRVAERATEEMRASRKFPMRPDQARVRLQLVRKREGSLVEVTKLVEETFMVLPTNFIFTVTDEWPVKKFVWEGETSVLTERDKAEIKSLLGTYVEHATNMANQYEDFLHDRTLIVEQEAMLKGIEINQYKRDLCLKAKNELSGIKLSKTRPKNKDVRYMTFPDLNLVKITVDNEQYGKKPLAAFCEDMSGAILGPEWFSKIDGKWWIVP